MAPLDPLAEERRPVHPCRALNPLGGPLGSHEGVRYQALTSDADPWAAPIRGSPDSAPFSVATYSKGAAIFSMAGRYLDSFSPGAFQVRVVGLGLGRSRGWGVGVGVEAPGCCCLHLATV
jgi:hypothetical protein